MAKTPAKAADKAPEKAAAKPAKAPAPKKKAMTKSAMFSALAEKTNLKKTEVVAVLDAVVEAIQAELGAKGPGIITIPGIARMKVRKVKAVKGGVKKTNPLNGQEYTTKDKLAYNKVTISPVKALKELLK